MVAAAQERRVRPVPPSPARSSGGAFLLPRSPIGRQDLSALALQVGSLREELRRTVDSVSELGPVGSAAIACGQIPIGSRSQPELTPGIQGRVNYLTKSVLSFVHCSVPADV